MTYNDHAHRYTMLKHINKEVQLINQSINQSIYRG